MILAAQAEGIVATDIEKVAVDRIVAVGVAMAANCLFGDLVQPAPSMVVAVPVKYFSTKPECKPIASKICAPQ